MRNPDVMSTPERDRSFGESVVTIKFYKGNMANVERLTVEQAKSLRDSLTDFIDGAPEPEAGAEEEVYQAGCGSWDCRAPECGRA